MADLLRRIAVYADATTVEGKTSRKKFNISGLVGVVSFFNDGTRELEPLYDPQLFGGEVLGSKEYKIAQAKINILLEPKSDGGLTFEETTLRKTRR